MRTATLGNDRFTEQELILIRDALQEYKFTIGKKSRHFESVAGLQELFRCHIANLKG